MSRSTLIILNFIIYLTVLISFYLIYYNLTYIIIIGIYTTANWVTIGVAILVILLAVKSKYLSYT